MTSGDEGVLKSSFESCYENSSLLSQIGGLSASGNRRPDFEIQPELFSEILVKGSMTTGISVVDERISHIFIAENVNMDHLELHPADDGSGDEQSRTELRA
jgi:hypothetical protein